MNSKSFARSNFPETHLNDTSMSLISYITKVVCVERYLKNAMIEHGKVGSACVVDERAIPLADRMIEVSSSSTIEEKCKICETVGMVSVYKGSDGDMCMRRGVGCRKCGRDFSKLCAKAAALQSRLCDVVEKVRALLLRMEGGMAGSPAVTYSRPASWTELGHGNVW